MREVFYEESSMVQDVKSAKRKYIFYNVFSIVPYVIIGLWLFFIYGNLIITPKDVLFKLVLVFAPVLILFLFAMFSAKKRDRIFADYDYTFISGSIRVSKVINNVKRKNVIKFDTDFIEKVGKYNSETFKKIEKYSNVKKIILTSNCKPSDGKDFYYIFLSDNSGKKLLIFDCSQLFIHNVLSFCKRHVREDA